MDAGLPLGVYISIPFCSQKCTYCNFASGVFPADLLEEYLAALDAELEAEGWEVLPDTLYLGGGTPSLLKNEALERILAWLPAVEWKEATIEAAPGTVNAARAGFWNQQGLDRVSLGVQSFVAGEISATGRKHSAEMVEREVGILGQAGFSKINIDLIAGLPYQTEGSWRESLEWVERLAPPHVSVYMLEADQESRLGREIVRGGTRWGAGAVPEEGQIAEFYHQAVERLGAMGIHRYEISNFARAGFESLHNLKYWRRQPYRGFGADAHSFDGRWRRANVQTAGEYVERGRGRVSPLRSAEEVSAQQASEERFFLGLREVAGIEPSEGEWRRFAGPIGRLSEQGLLDREGRTLMLTERGILFSNEVFAEFV